MDRSIDDGVSVQCGGRVNAKTLKNPLIDKA
jgi:hypothetical protein